MSMDMHDMAAALAGLDEGGRRTMLRSRMEAFAAMGEEERRQGMAQMLTAIIHTLSDDDHRKLVVSRTWVLSELPHETQVSLIRTHFSILGELSEEQRQLEMGAMQVGLEQLPAEAREDVAASMQAAQG